MWFIHRKGTLFLPGVLSLILPDNCYINANTETVENTYIEFTTLDEQTAFYYQVDVGCASTAEELALNEDDFGPYTSLVPIQAVELNGLKGHFHIYKTQSRQYLDARFQLETVEQGGVQLVFGITTKRDVMEIVKLSGFKDILKGIRKDSSSVLGK